MQWITNAHPKRALRHLKILGITFPPLVSVIVGLVASFAANRNPDSFLAEHPILILVVSLLPLLAWGYAWKAYRISLRRWPSRIGIGEEGIVAEFELVGRSTRRFEWKDVEGVRVFDQPLGWGPVALLILRGGPPFMEMEVWGDAALELKRRVEEFKKSENSEYSRM